MQCFSTVSIPSRQKVSFWNTVAADAVTEMLITPRPGCKFEGTLYRANFGALGLGKANSMPAQITRTSAQIARANDRLFLIHLCNKGRFSVFQGGREATLDEGDFTINDTGEPFTLLHHTPCEAVVVRVPERLMRSYLPSPEDLTGRAISGRSGLGALAFSLLRTLSSQLHGDAGRQNADTLPDGSGAAQADYGIAPARIAGVTDAVLEIVAGACAEVLQTPAAETSVAHQWRLKIRSLVESSLKHPDLSSSMVARALGISERYVRAVFSAEGESVSAYVARRRLEECARRLRDPLWRTRTISEIAFDWGFNSLGAFGRAFKVRYGVTPHEFRNQGLLAEHQSPL